MYIGDTIYLFVNSIYSDFAREKKTNRLICSLRNLLGRLEMCSCEHSSYTEEQSPYRKKMVSYRKQISRQNLSQILAWTGSVVDPVKNSSQFDRNAKMQNLVGVC